MSPKSSLIWNLRKVNQTTTCTDPFFRREIDVFWHPFRMLLPIRFRSGGFRFATTPGYDLRSLRDQDYRPNLTISPTNIVTRVECHQCHPTVLQRTFTLRHFGTELSRPVRLRQLLQLIQRFQRRKLPKSSGHDSGLPLNPVCPTLGGPCDGALLLSKSAF